MLNRSTRIIALTGILAVLSAVAVAPAMAAPTVFYLDSYNATDATQAFCSANLLPNPTPPGCGNEVTAPMVFASGHTYLVLVSGAVSAWGGWPAVHCGTAEPSSYYPSSGVPNEPAGDDAQFRFAVPLATGCPTLPKQTSLFQVDLGSGWFHPVGIAHPSKPSKDYPKLKLQHPYLFTFTGEGIAPQFRFIDWHPSDNSGQFKIVVFG
jgi:hypothetical protein